MEVGTRRNGVRLGLGLAVVLIAATAAIAPAGAAVRTWPGGVVTYHVVTPSLRWPVHQAAAEWNRSGARVRIVERPAGQARLAVRAMRGGGCSGAVGYAPLGALPPGWNDTVWLQARCGRFLLVDIAVHEFGHTLGLGHDTRHCSVMSPVTGGGACKDVIYPWEYRCHPLEVVDVRRAVALYGGRVPRKPRARPCLSAPTPTPAVGARADANPAGTFAATRITWRNPPSRSLRRVVVTRRKGAACPTYPSLASPALPAGIQLREGELVADIDARGAAGAVQEAFDNAPLAPGRWCYTVWAIGPKGRYARAAKAKLAHPGRDLSAARIGLTATLAPATGVRVRLTWTNPAAPAVENVVVERSAAPCPARAAEFEGYRISELPAPPGAAVMDDTDAVRPGGTWCYGVRFVEAGSGYQDEPARFLLQVDGVPEPPNAPPVARISAYPVEGSITDGTNEIFLADQSRDDDGQIVDRLWDFGDGTTSVDASPGHVYTAPGTYVVTLRVTDDRGATATTTQAIAILP